MSRQYEQDKIAGERTQRSLKAKKFLERNPTSVDSEPRQQAGHTPGPWKASATGVIVTSGPFDDEPDCLQQTAIYPRICTLNCSDFSDNMRIANARLIAASPALLEALKFYAARETYYIEGVDGHTKIQRDENGNIARAAIKQAQGVKSCVI